MKVNTFLRVAREGWLPLVMLVGVGLVVEHYFGPLWLLPLAVPFAILFIIFYDPERYIPPRPLGLVAPADGVIIDRLECHDPYLEREAIRLTIRVRQLGAYFFRAPTEGQVREITNGRDLPRIRQSSWLHTDEDDDVVLVVTRGSLLGARPCMLPFGERVGQGRRCGYRRLAREIEVYIPSNCRVDVEAGQPVKAGHDVLATLVR